MRLLVTGATGLLGGWICSAAHARGHEVVAFSERGRDGSTAVALSDRAKLTEAFASAHVGGVIHAAAMSAVDACARDPGTANVVNGLGTETLAGLAARAKIPCVYVSTDLVFDGERSPYGEELSPAPVLAYGKSKAAGEIGALHHGAMVARVALLFGPTRNQRRGFFDQQVDALRARTPLRLFHDEWRTAAPLDFAAEALVRLVEKPSEGVFHVAGDERLSRLEMGQRLAGVLGVPFPVIEATSRTTAPGEPRPRDVALTSTRLRTAFPELNPGAFDAACRRMLGIG